MLKDQSFCIKNKPVISNIRHIVLLKLAVDLRTIDHADEPILVDDSPPIAGDLFDGPYAGRDLVFTKDKNEVFLLTGTFKKDTFHVVFQTIHGERTAIDEAGFAVAPCD